MSIIIISGHNATPILMALNGASAHPRVCQALSAMLAKNALNPADITVVSIFTFINLYQITNT